MEKSVQIEKGRRFLELHAGPELVVIPNAWDAASAALLADLGFPAIATTSAGIAFSRGYPDGERISRDEMLSVVRLIVGAVDVPVTADLESGYGREPAIVAETVRLAIEAGAVGANIEDSTKGDPRDKGKPLFDLELAVERYRAARAAADASGIPFVLNARLDCFFKLRTGPDVVEEAERRGNAYVEAGASCVFVIAVTDIEIISRLTSRIKAPLNVLVAPGLAPLSELKAIGVRRLTFGASLSRVAFSAAARVARETRDRGRFSMDPDVVSNQQLGQMLAKRRKS